MLSVISTLAAALSAIEAVGRRELMLLVDAMHYGRSGTQAADVAAPDPHLIGYLQISDVKLVPDDPHYFQESAKERLVPGPGELDDLEMLAAIPAEVSIGIEVPMWSAARS